MATKDNVLDYLTEIPSGKWIMREKPKGRAVGFIELVPAQEGLIYEVSTWHENPVYAEHIGFKKFFRDACALAWLEGRRRTPPVAQTKWTEDMVRGSHIKRG